MPFGMPDAAMVSQMAKKDNVPPDQLMQWAANKGIPVALVQMMLKYDALQAATQRQAQSGPAPTTTVAQDLDQGLAGIRQQQQQPPPANPGIAGLDAGSMETPKFAGGGIVAFANTGAVSKLDRLYRTPTQSEAEASGAYFGPGEDPEYSLRSYTDPNIKALQDVPAIKAQHEKELADRKAAAKAAEEAAKQAKLEETARQFNITLPPTAAPAPAVPAAPAAAGTPAGTPPTQNQARVSSDEGGLNFASMYAKNQKIGDAAFNDQLERAKGRELYNMGTDPSIDLDRQRILAEKLANDNKIHVDHWDALVQAGLAMAASASQPRLPGQSNMLTDLTAGMKAGTDRLAQLNTAYEANQKQLDKELVQLNHLDYMAKETNNKSIYDQKLAKEKDIDALQNKQIEFDATIQSEAAKSALAAAQIIATNNIAKAQLAESIANHRASLSLEQQKAIESSVTASVKPLYGALNPATNQPYTEDEISAIAGMKYLQMAQRYELSGVGFGNSAPASPGSTNVAPSGGAGTSSVRSAADKIIGRG